MLIVLELMGRIRGPLGTLWLRMRFEPQILFYTLRSHFHGARAWYMIWRRDRAMRRIAEIDRILDERRRNGTE